MASTSQESQAFNQPLSFNTSSVTVMDYMFAVRTEHSTLSACPPVCILARVSSEHLSASRFDFWQPYPEPNNPNPNPNPPNPNPKPKLQPQPQPQP